MEEEQPSPAAAPQLEPAGRTPAWLDASLTIFRGREWEILWLSAILLIALFIRVYQLGSVPAILTGDETDNLQDAYHIIAGNGPGFFGFDWKPAPIFSLYPMAWTIEIFGDSIGGIRMFPVILSMLALGAFYFVARRTLSAAAALPALLLMAANVWVLHFSRTAWENMNAALFALGACYAVTRAIETGRRAWWACTGLFIALGMYGYFSGRFIFVSVLLAAGFAVAMRLAGWRDVVQGLGVAAVVSAVLFAPMALTIVDDWDHFNRRTDNVSVFSGEPYEGETSSVRIVLTNLERNIKGFLLLDGDEFSRGLWGRYNPEGRGPLNLLPSLLFWGGLVAGIVRWRKTYVWFTLLAPLFMSEVFSRGTPDLARAIVAAPVYFLFIGLLFDEVLRRVQSSPARQAALYGVAIVAAYVAMTDVGGYFDWQRTESVQRARLPGIASCELPAWRGLALEAARRGRGNLEAAEFDAQRRELRCDDTVNAWLGLDPGPGPKAPAPVDGPADARRLFDLQTIADSLEVYHERNGGYPTTDGKVQSLCTFRELDAGCALESVLKPIPRDPVNEGYWYRSDGRTFTLYAELETTPPACSEVPEFFRNPARVHCLDGKP